MADNPTKPIVIDTWANSAGPADLVEPSQSFIEPGWPLSSVPPPRQYFNWFFNWVANGVRYFCRRGIADWDPAETYQLNDISRGDDAVVRQSLLNGNSNQLPSTQTAAWGPVQIIVPYARLSGLPTTIGGYGITDAVIKDSAGVGQNIAGPLEMTQMIVEAPGSTAIWEIKATDAPANQGDWVVTVGSASWTLGAYSDSHGVATAAIAVGRTGSTVSNVVLGGTAQVGTTQSNGDNSTNFATTAFLKTWAASSPALGGVPTAPTAAGSANTAQVATCAMVQAAIALAIAFTDNEGSATGYLEIPCADITIIVQFGEITGPSHTAEGFNYTFPLAFPTKCSAMVVNSKRVAVGSTPTGYVNNPSNTAGSGLSTTTNTVVLDEDSDGVLRGFFIAVGW